MREETQTTIGNGTPPCSRGVTFLDTIIGIALMVVVFVGITSAFQLSIDVVSNNKARSGAVALANEQIEYIRSLPYNAVGVVGGDPLGTLSQTENINQNGVQYTRRTLIVWGDDPKDGVGGADQNTIIRDYKAIKIELSWNAGNGVRTLFLVTRASPPDVET
ncbi:MAG TPA: hypothetical protein VJH33_02000 [Candidatus Paceibacterota bacterium]